MMKKYLVFGMMGALALSFGACSSEDEMAPVNPTYDPVANTVNANFAFNVAGQSSKTRMTAATTQANDEQSFRGMQDAKLIALTQDNDGRVLVAAQADGKVFNLGNILNKDEVDWADKSHRVVELALPVGTNTLLFYSRAFRDGNAEGLGVINGEAGAEKSGVFNPTAALSDIQFNLTRRLDEANETKLKNTETAIATVLTQFIQASISGNDFWFPSFESLPPQYEGTTGYTNMTDAQITAATETGVTNPEPTINATSVDKLVDALGNEYYHFKGVTASWKAYGIEYAKNEDSDEATNADLVPLEEILGNAYYKFTKIDDGAARAGSGASVARMISDLWKVVGKVNDATATSAREALAQNVAATIVDLFDNYFAALPTDGSNTEWLAAADVATTAGVTGDVVSDLNVFPTGELALPMGAAQLLIADALDPEKDTEFSYDNTAIKFHLADTDEDQTMDVKNFMYPSELMYFGNSPVRVNDNVVTEPEYPNGVGDDSGEESEGNSGKWDIYDWGNGWSTYNAAKHVEPSTRSVAMTHDINYGNALLATTLTIANTDLYDNRDKFYEGEGNAKIGKAFEVTGVLVGGQPVGVDWQYLPLGTTFDKVIYDRQMNGTLSLNAAGTTAANYTMVLDNYNSTLADNKQSAVYVALELKNNNTEDFWGDHNLVRAGGTFYLVGKLDPAATTSVAPVWPAKTDKFRSTPPYDADGKTKKINRVFIQDFVTKANFTIGAQSLQNAFVTVPDLRSAEISLGLSVDLEWESGYEFEVEIQKH